MARWPTPTKHLSCLYHSIRQSKNIIKHQFCGASKKLHKIGDANSFMGGLEMELPLSSEYTILERPNGHVPTMGKSAGEELNWAYRLRDTKSDTEIIGMFCKPNYITFLDISTWNTLKNSDEWSTITWYVAPVGYATRTRPKNDTCPILYLHQLVTNHVANGKGQASVDHINQNKLDNRSENLRIVTQSVQNSNRGKVSRHASARPLPPTLQGPLPKFCVYYKECYNKEKGLYREFFTIEGHPAQEGKRRATSKSGALSIQEKLAQALVILQELNNQG